MGGNSSGCSKQVYPALGAAAELQSDDRHSTVWNGSHGGAGRLRPTQRDKGDAARQGRRQILHRTPKPTQHLEGDPSTADAPQKKRCLSRRPRERGGVRCSPAADGAPERASPQGLPPLADRSTGPSDHSAQHPADCTSMRATRRIPGEPKRREAAAGSPFADSRCPSISTDRQSQCSNETETSYREGLRITSRTAELAGTHIVSKTVVLCSFSMTAVVFVCRHGQHEGYSTKQPKNNQNQPYPFIPHA